MRFSDHILNLKFKILNLQLNRAIELVRTHRTLRISAGRQTISNDIKKNVESKNTVRCVYVCVNANGKE